MRHDEKDLGSLSTTNGIVDAFCSVASLQPNSVAVTDGPVHYTYQAISTHAERIAGFLQADPELRDRRYVGICMESGPHLVAAILAIWTCGAAYVPLDPAQPGSRLSRMTAETGLTLILTDGSPVPGNADIATFDVRTATETPGRVSLRQPPPESTAYVMYTSGSTGQPKGVEVLHRSVSWLVFDGFRDLQLSDTDVWTMFHSFAFDVSVWEMWGCLTRGARLVIVSRDIARSTRRLLGLLTVEQVTVLCLIPSAFRHLARAAYDSGTGLPAIRYAFLAGEPFDVAAANLWRAVPGNHQACLVNAYGPTECTVYATARIVTIGDLQRPRGPTNIGHPLPGVQTLIDFREGSEDEGELLIGGPGVARGYLGNATLNGDRFLSAPAPAAGRYYRTGDLVRRCGDGSLEYLGRMDSQLKLRGYRIEPGEIEHTLKNAVPEVAEIAVWTVIAANGEPVLVAWYVASRNLDDALRVNASVLLPPYMVPARVVRQDALPVGASGKIDRRRLGVPGDVRGGR